MKNTPYPLQAEYERNRTHKDDDLSQTSGQELDAKHSNGIYLAGTNGITEKIKRAMYDAARQFVYIGSLLWAVQEYDYYLEGGYKDVYEYAEAELDFKRSSTKNFIAICKEFSNNETKWSADGAVQTIGAKISMTLQPEYEQFNYSQLCELLAMSPAQREQVQPDMTVRELREIKKQPAQEPDLPPEMETIPFALPDDPTVGQTSGQEKRTDSVSIVMNNRWCDVPQELIRQLVKLAGIRCTPSMCFDITIQRHKG